MWSLYGTDVLNRGGLCETEGYSKNPIFGRLFNFLFNRWLSMSEILLFWTWWEDRKFANPNYFRPVKIRKSSQQLPRKYKLNYILNIQYIEFERFFPWLLQIRDVFGAKLTNSGSVFLSNLSNKSKLGNQNLPFSNKLSSANQRNWNDKIKKKESQKFQKKKFRKKISEKNFKKKISEITFKIRVYNFDRKFLSASSKLLKLNTFIYLGRSCSTFSVHCEAI